MFFFGINDLEKKIEDLKSLTLRDQRDILALQKLGPKLLDQISYWLKTGKVAKNKIITLWKNLPRAIPKGTIGKPVEFGRKWIVNCYRGGYVLSGAPENVKISDQNCVEKSLDLHWETFQDGPKTYATDGGLWWEENICHCIMTGIKKIGIQPKGKSILKEKII